MHWKLRIVEEMQPLQSKNDICTDGKVLWSGNQQLRATTPANWYWQVKAVYNDKAPPWKEQNSTEVFCVVYLCEYNVGTLRCTQPERSRQGLYDAGGSRSWSHVQLWPWLDENKQMCLSEQHQSASWQRRYPMRTRLWWKGAACRLTGKTFYAEHTKIKPSTFVCPQYHKYD